MPDNFIRIKQLDKPELSGFIYDALSGRGLEVTSNQLKFSGDFLPATSGDKSLGSSSLPFSYAYTSGGIYFNNEILSVVDGDLKLNGVSVTGDLGGGVVGPSGATGSIGPSGQSGRNIIAAIGTGVGNNGGFTGIYFSLSGANDTSFIYTTPISLPVGPSGGSGLNVTGILVSGSGLNGGDSTFRFLFSNGSSGNVITLPVGPTGAVGDTGPVGGFNFVFLDATGFKTGEDSPPRAFIDQLQNSGYNPSINLIRGFTYDFSYAGLNTNTVNEVETNALESTGEVPGYLRLCFFTSGTVTGRYISSPPAAVDINQIFVNSDYDLDGLRAIVRYDSASSLKYGFELINLQDENTFLGQRYVLGTVNFFDSSPPGPVGATGSTGPQGNAGATGPAGPQGIPGPTITGVEQSGSVFNSYRYLISGSIPTNYFPLPTGSPGPSGVIGLTGPAGPRGDSYKTSFYSQTAAGKKNNAAVTGNTTFTLNDELQFTHDNFKNLAYGVNQKLLFVAENTGTYWNGRVLSYDIDAGVIKVNVESPYGCNSAYCSISGGNPIFSGIFNNNIFIDVNLDVVSAVGPIGPTGVTGAFVSGATNVGGTGMFFTLSNGNDTNTISIPTGGATGATGAMGPSGRSIILASGTGVGVNGGTSGVFFLLSGSGDASYTQTNTISLPVGPSGAVGAYVSTLIQNGNQVNFVLSTTAQITPGIILPSGASGLQGAPGAYITGSQVVTGLVGGEIVSTGLFFKLNNNTNTPAVSIPTGGPIGAMGAMGPSGRSIILASGTGVGVNGGTSGVFFLLSGSGDASYTQTNTISLPVGPSGFQGPTGDIAFNIKYIANNNSYGVLLESNTVNYIDFSVYDAWDCYVTGQDVEVQFLPNLFKTGLVTMLRITNSGCGGAGGNCADVGDNPIVWGTGIYWPNDISAFFPEDPGKSMITTFTRFPNKNGLPVYFGTYSTSYFI